MNVVSLSYQFLGDSQAQNSEKHQRIISLENTLKAKDEHIIDLENTLKTKDARLIILENTLKTKEAELEQLVKLNMVQSSFPQGSHFRGPQGPQFFPRTNPHVNIPLAHRRSSRSAPYKAVEHYS